MPLVLQIHTSLIHQNVCTIALFHNSARAEFCVLDAHRPAGHKIRGQGGCELRKVALLEPGQGAIVAPFTSFFSEWQ